MPALAAMLFWAVAAGTASLWWLHMPSGQATSSAGMDAPVTTQTSGSTAGLARALGQTAAVAASPDVQKRFQLLGVISGTSGRGSALISVDAQHRKTFLLGQNIDDQWRVHAISARTVTLAADGQTLELKLPDSKTD